VNIRRAEEVVSCLELRMRLGTSSKWMRAGLLQVAVLAVGADQRIKNGEDVATIFNHTRKHVAKMGFAFCVLVPLGQNRRWYLNVTAQLFRRMSAEEQAVKEGSLALRKSKIRNHIGRQNGCDRGHSKNAVYSKLLRRQVERQFQCREPVKVAETVDATDGGLTGSNRT